MKKTLWAIGYLVFAAWIAFDPFGKAPIHPDPVGKAFQLVCGGLVLLLGWILLRKRSDDSRPDW